MNNNNIKPLKKLGQNFLISKSIIDKIIQAANINDDLNVIEIGAGKGALTKEIEKLTSELILIEKDTRLIENLKTEINCKKILNEDVLNIDFNKLIDESFNDNDNEVLIIGNLPYNIATKLIINLLKTKNPRIRNYIFMIQKEVAQRLTAKPKTKEYGSLTILVDALSETRILFDVCKNNFFPAPKVTSSIVEIIPERKIEDDEIEKLQNLTKALFANRRKMINKALKTYVKDKLNNDEIKTALDKINLSEKMRPEELDFWDINNIIREFKI